MEADTELLRFDIFFRHGEVDYLSFVNSSLRLESIITLGAYWLFIGLLA